MISTATPPTPANIVGSLPPFDAPDPISENKVFG